MQRRALLSFQERDTSCLLEQQQHNPLRTIVVVAVLPYSDPGGGSTRLGTLGDVIFLSFRTRDLVTDGDLGIANFFDFVVNLGIYNTSFGW